MSGKATRHACHIDGLGEISLEIPQLDLTDAARVSETVMHPLVKASADTLAERIRAKAPNRTGTLARGIIVSPAAERSTDPVKIVRDIYFDASMNDAFVKTSMEGERYYYPASQEYGFRKVNGGHVPGRYYMRDATVEYAAEHRDRVADGIDNVLEEL